MFGRKKKGIEMMASFVDENIYGEMEYSGKEIYTLIAEYVDVFKQCKKHYDWGVAVKFPNKFEIIVHRGPDYWCVTGKYNDIELKNYQLSLLVDKMVPKMMQEIATERVRVTKMIDEL